MSGGLQAFFAQEAGEAMTEKVVVSDRFKDKDGKPVPWEIRSMTEAENEEIRKSATRKVKSKNGMYTTETNNELYLAKLAVASVVFPDLKNVELQQSYGTLGAENLLRRMLLPGEYANLIEKVQEINGFDKDIEDLKEEIKN
ncbi:phage tail assembly chaperone [Paenibacillus larvae]|uniref:Phage protein n=1 Tax=Paenibacillus larvae subsp. larvae TaxID=147375 RepID=A0A2L1U441_9BACL|nr:phage portal protein [Paenibacillus larvae]AQZ46036.1 phage portal protein [Paenibacillus larvae subsp. pulvifaciens]AVF27680.1 phage protein [Paenibacillus larvae subsp. larvae]MCY7522149.1 phage portal protein [Paenibacillus larvae]MCY9503283.1 phage portal protein [Paenibacillus larvae]MCY9677871.1 phage portal protein [Paenibacillus larvae]